MNVEIIFYGALFASVILGCGFLAGVCTIEAEYKSALFLVGAGIFLSIFSFVLFYNEGQEHIIEKKICPVCRVEYDQTESFCSKDGEKLVFIVPQKEEE